MKKLPVQVISIDQGVPIPNTKYSFTIDGEKQKLFNTEAISIGNTVLERAFIIGVTVQDSFTLSILSNENELANTVAPIGVLCELISVEDTAFESTVICKILARTKLEDLTISDEIGLETDLQIIWDKLLPGEKELTEDLKSLIRVIVTGQTTISERIKDRVIKSKNPIRMSNILAASLPISEKERYKYLQSENNLERFSLVVKTLIQVVESKRHTKRTAFIPFDQLGLTQAEPPSRNSKIEENLSLVKPPPHVLEKIEREMERLKSLPPSSLEYQALYEYINWLSEVPWGLHSYKDLDLKEFLKLLNSTHYGLDDVKEHILEYLVIEKITKEPKGTVLCFVGPPGTGKTSIAKQIAKSCNREIIKIAMGGMSDESELRGHRRTYVASRPGRIIAGLKNARTMDPLFLFDEVDKIDTKRGDPMSALLEVLDPEQNSEFIDRYLEVETDLSKALFICTANYEDRIPPALLDRLEIITFRDYTRDEREEILRNFLIPNNIKDYKLEEMNLSFDESAIKLLADTQGVRTIERIVKKLLRKAATKIFLYEESRCLIDEKFIIDSNVLQEPDSPIGF